MRSQANTARLLEGNPTLMRLRDLKVLEKAAAKLLGHDGVRQKGGDGAGRHHRPGVARGHPARDGSPGDEGDDHCD